MKLLIAAVLLAGTAAGEQQQTSVWSVCCDVGPCDPAIAAPSVCGKADKNGFNGSSAPDCPTEEIPSCSQCKAVDGKFVCTTSSNDSFAKAQPVPPEKLPCVISRCLNEDCSTAVCDSPDWKPTPPCSVHPQAPCGGAEAFNPQTCGESNGIEYCSTVQRSSEPQADIAKACAERMSQLQGYKIVDFGECAPYAANCTNAGGVWRCPPPVDNMSTVCDDRDLLKADARIIHNQDELIKSYERKIARLEKQLESYAALKKQADQITAQQDLFLKALTRGCTLTCGTECFDGQKCKEGGK